MNQGDIIIVSLDPTVGHEQAKTRPCVLIQCNSLNKNMGTIIIAPITSKKFNLRFPNIVKLNCSVLKKSSSIKIEQLRCIYKSRVKKIIGSVSLEELLEIKEAIKVVFDI